MSGTVVMIYDREDYGGERAPESILPRVGSRFLVSAVDALSGRGLWSRRATSIEEARSFVPRGGAHFDRSTNWPCPMVPVEGWRFDTVIDAPREALIGAGQ